MQSMGRTQPIALFFYVSMLVMQMKGLGCTD